MVTAMVTATVMEIPKLNFIGWSELEKLQENVGWY